MSEKDRKILQREAIRFSLSLKEAKTIVKEKEKEFILSVYKGCDWNKVESITRIKLETAKDFESYNTSDPKIIVFLS